ncbi:MAG: aldehyde dehydrogenase family protein, partial [Ignavibacteriales bacterium]
MAREYGFLVDGKWRDSTKKREIRSPYNDEVVGVINIPAAKEAKEAIDSAEKAFEKFKNSPSYERSAILRRIADGIERRKEELARTIVEENGKPIKTARVEVARAVMTFTVGAEEANRFSGGELVPIDTIPGNEERFGMSRRFPLGIIKPIKHQTLFGDEQAVQTIQRDTIGNEVSKKYARGIQNRVSYR